MATVEEARNALKALSTEERASRRKSGKVIAVSGRHINVLPYGEGNTPIVAHRGAFEWAVGDDVAIEKIPGEDYWKAVGIADRIAATQSSGTYDRELPGRYLYDPISLENINVNSYTFGQDLDLTVRNVQKVVDGVLHVVTSEVIDMSTYIPAGDADDFTWCVIHLDPTDDSIGVHEYEMVDEADPYALWVDAVNDLDISLVAILLVLLQGGMTAEWSDAYRIKSQGYAFGQKRIIRLPNYTYITPRAKASVDFNGLSNYEAQPTTWTKIDDTNLSLTMTTSGGDVEVHFHGTISAPGLDDAVGDTNVELHINVEHTDPTPTTANIAAGNGMIQLARDNNTDLIPVSFTRLLTSVAAGEHTFKLVWKVSEAAENNATLYAGDYEGQFWVKELP
jgi:hypothetical protein